jgi:peroxin-19
MSSDDRKELDDILERALDEFDVGEDAIETGKSSTALDAASMAASKQTAAAEAKAAGLAVDEELEKAMQTMMENMKNPDFARTLDATIRELNEGGPSTEGAGMFGGVGTGGADPETDKNLAETLQMLAKLSSDQDGVDPTSAERMGEEVMGRMMKEFEAMGQKEDFDGVMDNMMRQLLSKDIMYVPMKQITEKYPEWLAKNEARLPAREYEQFGKQYQYFQQMVAVYETEPDNFPRLMELMQDMQQTGQPPAEIVKDLAPGLEFSEDGMPKLPGMPDGAMPGMPGVPGMPGCSLM